MFVRGAYAGGMERIYGMPFASVYPLYIAKVERKGRTKADVDEVKARLPVWKHQLFRDGTDEWVGSA